MDRARVTDFSGFVGSAATVAKAKRGCGDARLAVVVGPPGSGRTTFLRCLRAHFAGRLRFADVSVDEPGPDGLRAAIRAAATRKHGVMERFVGREPDDGEAGPRLELRLVIDGLDAPDRAAVAALEDAALRGAAGLLVATDPAGMRKLSGLRKRPGTLDLVLVPPGRDAVMRWARRTLMPAHPGEEELELLRASARACGFSIPTLVRAYAEPGGPEAAAAAAAPDAAADLDNAAALVHLFTAPPDAEWLLRTVSTDGGSMFGQLAWHNAPAVGMDEGAYAAALEAAMHGMRLERSGHVSHYPTLCAIGHALTAAPFAAAVARASRADITYTSATAQGGARAVARRALAAEAGGLQSVAEAAEAAAAAPGVARKAARAR